ncbi:M20 family metallopeptidase [Paenibacillus urinalis]|uniref:Peptidase M20 domain-containing protein 2 n=1 Tax=Paenibacillus urinalis TaxID=521520 RepID=A0ABY7XAS6_9BACL|nr:MULTISPECIES: M20 family metallopeptidase [Paenibacillus]WDH97117.1 M20 family metallopeptidase [Paenibacillus urinalis]WDI00780.1 M20 family metallopeptidase [Paenibacillus urinalis]GAK39460.1 metal-dependent amidase/aminoacylase/carboxypeptidase [Paenibacillus sp. TCA20]
MNKQTINQTIDQYSSRFKEISLYIGQNPELGNEEFLASARLKEELIFHGFEVEAPILGLETAFIGTYSAAKPGPRIALLCEYDALPELGHACGHHLICMMSLGAAVGLKSVIDEIGGSIKVFGTPAEETKGAKVPMAAAGLFDDCDIAMMTHPFYAYEKSGTSLAMDAIQFEFFGKSSHAAASPHEGINALDAVIQTFNGINAFRQQVKSTVRIHGIINHGGEAANIIPDYASAQFYVRASTRKELEVLTERVIKIAEGSALQTGCTLKTSNYETSYDEMNTNEILSDVFSANLVELGISKDEISTGDDHGSMDMGNVSLRIPAIHPYIKIIEEKHALHSKEFRDLAMEERALSGMILAAKALGNTAYDVITQPELLTRIKTAHHAVNHI